MGATTLIVGGHHFQHGWPGSGGYAGTHRAIVLGEAFEFMWTSTLAVSAYWAHPAILLRFVVLCHAHSGDGNEVAARINESLARRSLPVQDFVVPLRASVGVALARCDADTDPMELVHLADSAMYEAKRAARAARAMLAAPL